MEARTELIQIKVTPKEKKEIMIKSAKMGLKLSSYIRLKCLKGDEK